MLQLVIFGLLTMLSGCAHAGPVPANVVYKQGLEPVSLEKALEQVRPGQVVVLGEDHGTQVMANQQLQVLKTLREMGFSVSVGMEFFYYPQQPLVDAYRADKISEEEFLKQVEWGKGFSYEFYKQQVLFPQFGSEFVIALNSPRSLTSRISKVGVQGLTAEEKSLLPPNFTLGNDRYFERFKKIMGDHLPSGDALGRYFAAQSAWDDTMAWKAAEFLNAHPEQVLVIIVGEFHVQYGGGLPDRLKARGVQVTTFSLVNLANLSESEQKAAVLPSESDGSRADFIWTSRFDLEP